MWINREISTLIEDLFQKRPAILITGARQTGKSSLSQRLFSHGSYTSLDLPLAAKQASENGRLFLESKQRPTIIDEIQYAPELFRSLKVIIDQHRQQNSQFILTGSQKFSLMQGISESLAGRMSILELYTLSVSELKSHFQKELSSTQLLNWMIQGGYPEIYEQDLDPHQFFSDYIATYVERDVRQLLNIKHAREFDQFMRLLALRAGQTLSMSRLASEVGMSAHTIKNWLSVLEASNIIYLLKPYYENFGKRIVKSPKLYFLDTGLLCYLANIPNGTTLLNSPLLGAYFENLVLTEWLKHANNQGTSAEIYYYRNQAGLEIDFIIPQAGRLILLESKWADDSGEVPKNIRAMIKLVGADKILEYATITQTKEKVKVNDHFRVTNILEF